MLFHSLLFCFWIKVTELAFLTCYDAMKKVVTFNSTLFQQLQWNKLSGIPNFLPSHEAEHRIIGFFLSSVAYLYWAHHFFQLFPWSTASSWPSIMGLISNFCVPILKCFTYHDTATAHAVSSYTCWNHVWISGMRISSFMRNSINAHCQNMPQPVIFYAVAWPNDWSRQCSFHSGVRWQMELSHHIPRTAALPGICL